MFKSQIFQTFLSHSPFNSHKFAALRQPVSYFATASGGFSPCPGIQLPHGANCPCRAVGQSLIPCYAPVFRLSRAPVPGKVSPGEVPEGPASP